MARRGALDRPLNYRMRLKEDCGCGSMSELSVRRPRGRQSTGSIAQAGRVQRVAGGGLNRLHIHSGEGHNNIPNESKERENVKNEKGKKGQGDRYGGHHGTQSQYHDDGGNVLDGPPEATEKTRTISATMADSPSVAARGTSPPNAVRTPKNSEVSETYCPPPRTWLTRKTQCNPQSRKSPRPTHDSRKPLQHLSTAQPILVPVARTAAKSSRLTDRRLDSHVKGADIYVARLAWKRAESPSPQPKHSRELRHCSTPDSSGSSTDGKETEASQSRSRSLHDELSPLSRSCSPTHSSTHSPSPPPALAPVPEPAKASPAPLLSATSSRPCYRCVSYMHGAGIRRVFWTNADGEWEGGKVREMVEALEFAGGSAAGAGKREGEGMGKGMGMFVTKHEVLMLRRREMGGA